MILMARHKHQVKSSMTHFDSTHSSLIDGLQMNGAHVMRELDRERRQGRRGNGSEWRIAKGRQEESKEKDRLWMWRMRLRKMLRTVNDVEVGIDALSVACAVRSAELKNACPY